MNYHGAFSKIGILMSKAIFFNIPASGHINPSLGLTAELVRRGEEVVYFATERFRPVIEATGASFRATPIIDDHYIDQPGLNGIDPSLFAELMIGTCRDLLPALVELVRTEQPDYILHDSVCAWGGLVARVLDLPTVVSLALWSFTPGMLAHPPGAPDSGLSHGIRFHQISRQIGAQYGIRPLTYAELFNAPGDLTISYSSAELQPEAHLLDERFHFVGSCLAARGDEPDFPLELLDGKRVIYISLGTVLNRNADFFKSCLNAFSEGPYTVVMSIGNRLSREAFGPIPANFIVRNNVPPIEILKRSALFISHSGMNSVHEALSLNVPLLLVPQQAEQALTAARMVELGAGLRLEQTSPESLRAAAEKVLNEPGYRLRATHLGASLRQAGGPPRAADLVLARVAAPAGKGA